MEKVSIALTHKNSDEQFFGIYGPVSLLPTYEKTVKQLQSTQFLIDVTITN